MTNSPFHVGRPNIHDPEAFLQLARKILDSRWLTNNGQYVRDFETALASRLGVRHAIAACNATNALQILLRTLVGGDGREVILPAFTFVATAQAVGWLGLRPVFADVDPHTHCLDPEDVRRRITSKTAAILGVHLWGTPCDVDSLSALARAHDLRLIFDAAHAFGSARGATQVGGFGEAEVFSFHATKVLNTFEGGCITTNDDALAEKLRLIRNFGFSGLDRVEYLGSNAKMPEICAAMGLVNLVGVDRFIELNRERYSTYHEALADIPEFKLYDFPSDITTNYQYVLGEVDPRISRDDLVAFLHSKGVLARKYFTPGVNHVPPFGVDDGVADPTLPVSEHLARTVLVLPSGPSLSDDDVRAISALIRTFVEAQRA